MVRRPDIFPCVFEKQKLAIKLQKSGGQEKNKWKRFKWEKQSFCFLRKIRLNKPISTMYLLVPTPQALHLSLNTDTFSLSGQSPSVLVSCVPLPAGWKLLDARPPSGQQNSEEVCLDVLTSNHCVGLTGFVCFPMGM